MDRGPRGGLVSSETQCLLSLPLTSLLFTADSQPGQTLLKICVIPLSHRLPLAVHLNTIPGLLPQICALLPKGAEKILFGLYVGESKTQFFFLWC